MKCPVIVSRYVVRLCFVTQVNPSSTAMNTHVARDLLIRCTPSQPYRVHSHTRANLSLADQCLVPRRQTLVHFRMLGNARFGGCTTRKNQRAGGDPHGQRDRHDSPLHGLTIIRPFQVESITGILDSPSPCRNVRADARPLRPSNLLPARFDHRPLQRTVHLLHAAGIAGVVAARGNSDFRGDATADSNRGGVARFESASYRRGTTDPPGCWQFYSANPAIFWVHENSGFPQRDVS